MASDRGKAPAVKPPLSVRQNPDMQESYFALRKGIPDSLLPSLLSWSLEHYTQWVMGVTLVNQDRLNRLERIIELKVLPDGYRDDADGLRQILTANHTLHMQAIDIALRWADNENATELADGGRGGDAFTRSESHMRNLEPRYDIRAGRLDPRMALLGDPFDKARRVSDPPSVSSAGWAFAPL